MSTGLKQIKIIITLAIILLSGIVFFTVYLTPTTEQEKDIILTEDVNNFRKLATKLEKEGIITKPNIFYYTARLFFHSAKIYPGEYKVKPGTSVFSSLFIFTNYKNIHSYIVVIPEGSNSRQVANILKAQERLSGVIPGDIPEGILMPDTYHFEGGTSYEDILKRMAKERADFLDKVWETRALDLPYNSKKDAIIMASMIEEETGIKGERARIAGVFVNRLRAGMRLQSDPTVAYGLGKDSADGLKKSELRSNTKYNTYVVKGLPIGPITNPGREAILAALNPEVHDYYYFVADGSGGHVFSKTLAEHNENVVKWRVIEQKIRKNERKAK